MAVSRVPSPPPPEVNTPVAENWCYTQVRERSYPLNFFQSSKLGSLSTEQTESMITTLLTYNDNDIRVASSSRPLYV